MSRKTSIFYSALMLTAVNLLLRTAGTTFQVYLSGRIGASGIGLLQLVLSVASLSMTAGIAGIRTGAMYLTAEELGKKRPGNVAWVLSGSYLYSIICSSIVAIAVYLFAPTIAGLWIGDSRATDALRIFAAFMPVSCLCGVMTGYFTAANRITTLAAVEVAEQVCSITVTILALHFWAGTDPARACQAVIFGSSISACMTLISLVVLRLRERATVGARIPVAKRLTGIALPLAFADDLRSGISTLENLMVPKRLALYRGVSDPLALFGIVCGMVFPILMFPCAILFGLTELLIPEMARCNAADSPRRIRYLMKRSLKLVLLYGTVCAGIEFLLAEPLCLGLYRNAQAGYYLKLFSPLIIMLYADIITDAMIKGLGQQKASVRYNILTSSMDVALLFILLPRWGMMGYFISFALTHAINFGLSIHRLVKITGQTPPVKDAIICVLCAVFAVIVSSFAVTSAARVLAFLTVFSCLIWMMNVVSREDFQWIKGLVTAK